MPAQPPKGLKAPNIGSRVIDAFGSGFFAENEERAPDNSLIGMSNAKISVAKTIVPRERLNFMFSSEDNIQSEPIPVKIKGKTIIFYMSGGKIRFVNYTDDPTTEHTIIDADNDFDKNERTMLNFVGYYVVITNGVDKLAYVDTTLDPFQIVKFNKINDPTSAPVLTPSGSLSNGNQFPIYYAISFNSTVGETKASPIAQANVSKARDNWASDGTDNIKITHPTAPAGAKSWNLYVATASSGGTVVPSDLLRLASGIDIGANDFVDNGSLAINITAGSAPTANSTDGPICKYSSVVANGRIALYGDVKEEYNIWLGGTGQYPLDFSTTHGGYRIEISRGTGYTPSSVMTFRTGQGQSTIRVDAKNMSNDPKFFNIDSDTISYGNQQFVVWTATEQSSGAAGAFSPWSVVQAKDSVYFYNDDGIYTTGTKAQIQNLISTDRISSQIQPFIDGIRSDMSDKVVAKYFDNIVYFGVPSAGGVKLNTILCYDLSGGGMWYVDKIDLDWMFVLDTDARRPLLCIVNGKNIYFTEKAHMANDILSLNHDGSPYVVSVIGAPIGNNPAKSMFNYMLQAVFTISNPRGTIAMGVSYDTGSKVKTKQRTIQFSQYNSASQGSYADAIQAYSTPSDPYTVDFVPYSSAYVVDSTNVNKNVGTVRVKIPINAEYRSVKWFLNGQDKLLDFELVRVEYKSITVGVGEDL